MQIILILVTVSDPITNPKTNLEITNQLKKLLKLKIQSSIGSYCNWQQYGRKIEPSFATNSTRAVVTFLVLKTTQ